MADVWDSALKGATATHVMAVLGNSADDDGRNCYPGTRLIARRARVSERTVIRTIGELEAGGWLQVLARGSGAGNRSEYRLNVERLHAQAESWRAETRTRKGCHGVTLLPGRKKVTRGKQKGDNGAQKGDIDGAPLYVLPVNDPSGDPLPPNPLPREGARAVELDSAVDQVCSALGFGNRRRRPLLRRVIELAEEKGGPPATIALAMIAAWRRKLELGSLLRPMSVAGFFGDGYWRDEKSWA